jgi:hypothetical protein
MCLGARVNRLSTTECSTSTWADVKCDGFIVGYLLLAERIEVLP